MKRTFAGVGLVTLATLLLELLLTRIFSVTLSYHFAFMVISLALFGLGLSGVLLYLKPERYSEAELAALLARHSRRFALATVVALLFVLNHSVTTTMNVLQVERFGWQSFFQLAFLYTISSVPFFYGGMVVSLALFHLRRDVAALYFCDLAGASLACLVLDPVLRLLGGPNAVLFVALLAALAALVFGGSLERWRAERRSVVLLGALALLLGLNLGIGFADVGSFKWVRAEWLRYTRWNALSRVEVQEVPPHAPILTIDGQARTDVASLRLRRSFVRHQEVSALVHAARPRGKVLIIGPGGGVDVLSAMIHGHSDITLAEVNPIILYDVMLGRYRDYSGNLYGQPGVKVHVSEGRHFVRQSPERYAVIQATQVDTWAATAAGAFALTENYLYTVEAFEEFLDHLTPDGMLTMSRWVGVYSMEFTRLCSLAREALVRRGVRLPGRHVFAATSGQVGTMIVKRSPLLAAELDRLHGEASARNFTVVHSPRAAFRNPVSILLTARDPRGFYDAFPLDVRPVYDERPFFFYSVKPERALHALLEPGRFELNTSGTLILVALLGLVTLLVLSFIVVPLWIGRRGALAGRTLSKLRDLGYFVSLGLGFILVEIALLNRFALHLGHPIHALRVVLFALLLFAGLGSLLSGRVADGAPLRRRLTWVAGGVVVLVALYALVLGPLLGAAISFGFAARVAISLALLAPLGLLMGMLLPSGIRLVSARHAEIVPWAWGLNGAASVLGSVLAMVLSIHLGFTATLGAGALAYLVALAAAWRRA